VTWCGRREGVPAAGIGVRSRAGPQQLGDAPLEEAEQIAASRSVPPLVVDKK